MSIYCHGECVRLCCIGFVQLLVETDNRCVSTIDYPRVSSRRRRVVGGCGRARRARPVAASFTVPCEDPVVPRRSARQWTVRVLSVGRITPRQPPYCHQYGPVRPAVRRYFDDVCANQRSVVRRLVPCEVDLVAPVRGRREVPRRVGRRLGCGPSGPHHHHQERRPHGEGRRPSPRLPRPHRLAVCRPGCLALAARPRSSRRHRRPRIERRCALGRQPHAAGLVAAHVPARPRPPPPLGVAALLPGRRPVRPPRLRAVCLVSGHAVLRRPSLAFAHCPRSYPRGWSFRRGTASALPVGALPAWKTRELSVRVFPSVTVRRALQSLAGSASTLLGGVLQLSH